jgi:ribosome-associated protein
LALCLARLAWEKNAEDIVVLDVSRLTQITDYFVLITGQIDQHLKAISDHIVDTLKAQGIRPHHLEGETHRRWILIDYVDVIAHLFLPEVRQFYDLEALWGEAELLPLSFIEEGQTT